MTTNKQVADSQAWLTPGEAAAALGVTLNTLKRWADEGKLLAMRSTPGGHRRYSVASVSARIAGEPWAPAS